MQHAITLSTTDLHAIQDALDEYITPKKKLAIRARKKINAAINDVNNDRIVISKTKLKKLFDDILDGFDKYAEELESDDDFNYAMHKAYTLIREE